MEKQEIIDTVYLIDLSDEFNIKLNYEDRMVVSLGDVASLERKIEYFKAVAAEIGESEKGTLDVSNPQKASFLPQ
ncbi:hypothetical protein SDC9_179216 [bioreactor metagenome]|uniref:Cell division protein FtsQ n=1 Tax=bioreactor metagenome TaxID=1076179 RepID=A0A645H0B9_9ZZZZ